MLPLIIKALFLKLIVYFLLVLTDQVWSLIHTLINYLVVNIQFIDSQSLQFQNLRLNCIWRAVT